MISRVALWLAAACLCTAAYAAENAHSPKLDVLIAHFAKMHGIPESLIHRVVKRESGYNPRLVHRHFYGLMQITYQTAHSMGYNGPPKGLLDPQVNLTYAVPYLANAYKVAGGSETGAIRLYAAGYYYIAKRKHLLADLRKADSPSLEPPPPPPPAAPPPPPANPLEQLMRAMTGRQPVPSQIPPPPQDPNMASPAVPPAASAASAASTVYGPPAPR
jgi:soluble lytic murein transglycosylase-like protein